jgi:hypothetical protein
MVSGHLKDLVHITSSQADEPSPARAAATISAVAPAVDGDRAERADEEAVVEEEPMFTLDRDTSTYPLLEPVPDRGAKGVEGASNSSPAEVAFSEFDLGGATVVCCGGGSTCPVLDRTYASAAAAIVAESKPRCVSSPPLAFSSKQMTFIRLQT